MYAASNASLAVPFGTDQVAATQHYVNTGFRQNLPTNTLDGLIYLASNAELARTYGTDFFAALKYYLTAGAKAGLCRGSAHSSTSPGRRT